MRRRRAVRPAARDGYVHRGAGTGGDAADPECGAPHAFEERRALRPEAGELPVQDGWAGGGEHSEVDRLWSVPGLQRQGRARGCDGQPVLCGTAGTERLLRHRVRYVELRRVALPDASGLPALLRRDVCRGPRQGESGLVRVPRIGLAAHLQRGEDAGHVSADDRRREAVHRPAGGELAVGARQALAVQSNRFALIVVAPRRLLLMATSKLYRAHRLTVTDPLPPPHNTRMCELCLGTYEPRQHRDLTAGRAQAASTGARLRACVRDSLRDAMRALPRHLARVCKCAVLCRGVCMCCVCSVCTYVT
mmetsp:Transcript_8787/g.19535  ORF Transcript_8787/g.19535 Transcript_8787/m.19535 type:complete len:306 (+) Transcript_8787:514-1431(+)